MESEVEDLSVIEKQLQEVSKAIAKLLTVNSYTIAVAESCTGGMLSSILTDIPGSSDYFQMGLVVYSNQSKIQMVGVNYKNLHQYGAVSKEIAYELALGVKKIANTTIGVGITGIAGPTGGSEDKPLGTVYIGTVLNEDAKINKYIINEGDRGYRKRQFTLLALKMLLELLRSKSYFKLELS